LLTTKIHRKNKFCNVGSHKYQTFDINYITSILPGTGPMINLSNPKHVAME
jgi:hypothetical protein